MKMLEGLVWRERVVDHLGAMKGCVDYLGIELTYPWLYGGTGHAFVINIDRAAEISGPTAWNPQVLFNLAPNLGFRVDGLKITKEEGGQGFVEKQREAWELVRAHLDRDLPCYGWLLQQGMPFYFVINGYDDVGYHYSGYATGGPLPWEQLGELFVPVLEVRTVTPCDPTPPEKVVRDALVAALRHADNPEEWIQPDYRAGAEGYGLWAEGLESGEAQRDHHTWNVRTWLECRREAAAFLEEAKGRLPGRCGELIDEAASHYLQECALFYRMLVLHPPGDSFTHETFRSDEAAALVRQAADRDALARQCLRRIVDAL